MPIHGLEAAAKDGALLDLVPVVQQEAVFDGAADLFLAARDHLRLVRGDGLGEQGVAVADALQALQQVRDVADAVVEALAAI